MPGPKVYHLEYRRKMWRLKGASAEKALRVFQTKAKALKESAKIVRRQKPSMLKIHKKNGIITRTRSY
ncbi:DUF2188 domain-containing protein [bacterium]|nr:DUF2188 domain-containing protein [bacterium]